MIEKLELPWSHSFKEAEIIASNLHEGKHFLGVFLGKFG
jgi:hypothetical protein